MKLKKCFVALMSVLMIFCLGGVIYGAEATLEPGSVSITPWLSVFHYRAGDKLQVKLNGSITTDKPVKVKFVLSLDMRR